MINSEGLNRYNTLGYITEEINQRLENVQGNINGDVSSIREKKTFPLRVFPNGHVFVAYIFITLTL